MKNLLPILFAAMTAVTSLSALAEVGNAETLYNDTDVAAVLELLEAGQPPAQKNPRLLLCAKAKARYWACYRLSTTDQHRKDCDYEYCPTVLNRCTTIPDECTNL